MPPCLAKFTHTHPRQEKAKRKLRLSTHDDSSAAYVFMNQKKPEQLKSDDTRLGKGPKVLTGRKAFPKRRERDWQMLITRAQMLAKTAGRRDGPDSLRLKLYYVLIYLILTYIPILISNFLRLDHVNISLNKEWVYSIPKHIRGYLVVLIHVRAMVHKRWTSPFRVLFLTIRKREEWPPYFSQLLAIIPHITKQCLMHSIKANNVPGNIMIKFSHHLALVFFWVTYHLKCIL